MREWSCGFVPIPLYSYNIYIRSFGDFNGKTERQQLIVLRVCESSGWGNADTYSGLILVSGHESSSALRWRIGE